MPCYSPLKGFKDAETGGLTFNRTGAKEEMEVACGQCIGCRLDRSRMWAMRIVHESLHDDSVGNKFVTLTYRPKEECDKKQLERGYHVPDDWSLKKEHFQKFMKRLRQEFPENKIKYYHCGEYGSICKHGIDLEKVECPLCNVGRPHYHACLFNIHFDDLEHYATQRGIARYTSPRLEKVWKHGFVDVGDLTFESAAYVARYIMKKINGVNAEDHYTSVDIHGEITKVEPEYATMSNGIGKDWYEKYKSDLWPSDEVPVPGSGVFKKVPRYYENRLKLEDEELYEEVKLLRQKFRDENAEEYTPERLWQKYKVKKAQSGQLIRNGDL